MLATLIAQVASLIVCPKMHPKNSGIAEDAHPSFGGCLLNGRRRRCCESCGLLPRPRRASSVGIITAAVIVSDASTSYVAR